jgi:hypothetical protein
MVRKMKISSIYEAEPETNEEASEPTNAEANEVQANETATPSSTEAMEPNAELPTDQPRVEQPAKQPKGKILPDMPTTPKILQQVECQACSKRMCAKNLKYSHPKYCTARGREEQPEEIPIPKMEIINDAKIKKQGKPTSEETHFKTETNNNTETGGGTQQS